MLACLLLDGRLHNLLLNLEILGKPYGMEVADSARLLEVISMETDSQASTLPSALILKTSCFWRICSHGCLVHPRQFTENGKIKIGIIWLDSAIN